MEEKTKLTDDQKTEDNEITELSDKDLEKVVGGAVQTQSKVQINSIENAYERAIEQQTHLGAAST